MKEKLKRIKWLRKIVRAFKALWYKVKRPFDSAISRFYIKKNNHNRGIKNSDKIRIGFIAQIAWSWDKLERVYAAAKDREDVESFLFVVPEDNFDTYELIPDYTDNYFVEKYPESIKLLNEKGECLDLVDYNLDYLFYQRPFDYRLPEAVSSKRMVKHLMCCYLPYGFTASDAFNYNNLKNDFFDNQYFLFMDSPYMKNLFIKKYHYSYSRKIKRIEYLGYPGLEKYLEMGEKNLTTGYITWTPRWSFDEHQGGSTFLKYKDNFIEFAETCGKSFFFRPHPLIHAEIIRHNIMTEDEWVKYLSDLEKKDVLIDIESPIDGILEKTEILITDFSTIIGSFFMTGRPIIYCENGIEFNPVYQEMKDYMYVAHTWDEVQKYTNELLAGRDVLKSERLQFIEDTYKSSKGSGYRIIERICEDAKRK